MQYHQKILNPAVVVALRAKANPYEKLKKNLNTLKMFPLLAKTRMGPMDNLDVQNVK